MMTTTTIPLRILLSPAIVAIALGLSVVSAAAQADPPDPEDAPRRELLVADGTGRALDGGGSDTPFYLELEGESECPGDSANDQYRIDSYMVPVDADPTELVFTAGGPMPPEFKDYETFRMPLYKFSTDRYSGEVTGQAVEPGGPGPIPQLPPFTFGVYIEEPSVPDYEGGLPSGSYRIGVACTYAGRMTNYWETTIELAQDAADEPVGISWTVTGPQPTALAAADPASSTLVYWVLALAAVMAMAAYLLHRSSQRAPASDPSPPSLTEETVV